MRNGKDGLLGVCNRSIRWELELLEPRLLLSTAPTVVSINREIPAGASTEAASVTYAVAFSEPVTGLTSADFQLALSGTATASSTVVVSPSSGYNSTYDVTINNIHGKGTLGLNLVDNNGSIMDASGNILPNSAGIFQTPKTFATGSSPASVAVGDINGDGKADLVAANSGSNTVSILLGNGNGTYQAQQTLVVGTSPQSVAVADLNGDGKQDLVVTSTGNNTGVLLGNGDGTFGAQTFVAAGYGPLVVTDINGDGKPDLAFSGSVLLGNGDGTFQAPQSGGTLPLADLNGDGTPDTITAVSYMDAQNFYHCYLQATLTHGSSNIVYGPTYAFDYHTLTASAGDLNGDGKPDLIVVDSAFDTGTKICILLGNGDGTFYPGSTLFSTQMGVEDRVDVTISDVNCDGKADLLFNNHTTGEIDVAFGNGDGTFSGWNSATGSSQAPVVVADVNGDGNPDLVTTSGNTVRVALGTGSFIGQTYTVDQPTMLAFTNAPNSTAAGSIINGATGVQVSVEDSGGKAIGFDSSVVTLTLNGGTFASGGNTATATAVNGVATFNNLVINTVGSYTLTASGGTLPNRTSSSFAILGPAAKLVFTQQPANTLFGLPNGPIGYHISVAVQDASGHMVATDNSTVTLTLSSGTFASGDNTIARTATNGVAGFYNLIINTPGMYTLTASDGTLTGAVSSTFAIEWAPSLLSIHRESPAGAATEAASVTYAVTFNQWVTGVTSADFQLALTGGLSASSTVAISPSNGYNNVYHVTVNNISGSGTLGLKLADNGSIVDGNGTHLANATGTFQAQQVFVTGSEPNSVAVADVNGDNNADLIVANELGNSVSVLLGIGNGTFQPQTTFATGSNPESVAVADVNGDGKPDIITPGSVLLGNGDGTFQPQQTLLAGSGPISLAVVDVNRDGKPDLVVADADSNTAGILLGNGDGTFQAREMFAVGSAPYAVAIGDVNEDAKPDLVVANSTSNKISVLLGNGDGTFQTQKIFATGTNPYSVAVADVNGDGKPDVVVANAGSNTAGILLGKGDGTFQAQKTFATGTNPYSVAVADVNGDGKADVVVANASDYDVGLLLGNGDGTFQAQKTFAAGTSPCDVAVADVNGDGNPDLIVPNVIGNTVSVLLNNRSSVDQPYTIDQPAQLAFTQPPGGATAGSVVNPGTGIQVAVRDSGGATVGIDSSAVTLTLNGGTFAGGGNTVTVAAVNGVANFNNLVINTAGSYTMTASDGALAGATSGSFGVYPLGDVNQDGAADATDIDQAYAHFGAACTSQWKLCQDGNPVGQADVDYLVKTVLHTHYGDANLDGKIDFADFQILLDHWQVAGAGWACGDFTGSGTVDFSDFQKLLDNWNPSGQASGQQIAATNTALTTSAPASAGAVPAVLTESAATPLPADSAVNLFSRAALASAMTPSAEAYSASPNRPDIFSQKETRRPAMRQLRYAGNSVQSTDADTVDLLTQLHSRPVLA
jgi:hypothetical protein